MATARAPSLAADSAREPRARAIHPDLTIVVAGYLVLLLAIPSNQVLEVVGGAGTMAGLAGVFMFGLWAYLRLADSPLLTAAATPLHAAVLAFALATVASYCVGVSRAGTAAELSGADRALISLVSWSGVFLLVADGVRTAERLERLLKALGGLLVVNAVAAISQFMLGRNWLAGLRIPGLAASFDPGFDFRSGLARVSGTAIHSIEYATVQSIGLALILHWALFSASQRARALWGVGFVICAVSLPLTIARSAVIGLVAVLFMLVPTWRRPWQVRALMVVPFAIVAVRLAFPGVLGTIRSLFTYLTVDPSAAGRSSDYGNLGHLLSGHALFGRGVGTLIPNQYLILDNQYLLTLVTMGVTGLAALALLFGVGISRTWVARRRMNQEADRHLAQSLAAGLVVGTLTWAVFDGFSFPQATGLLFVLFGSVAVLDRVTSAEKPHLPTAGDRQLWWSDRGFRWPAALGLLAGMLTLSLVTLYPVQKLYQAGAVMQLHKQDVSDGLFDDTYIGISSLVTNWMRGDRARAAVEQQGGRGDYTIAQGDGSVAVVTDRFGFGPIISILASSASPDEASVTVRSAQSVFRDYLAQEQARHGAPEDSFVVARDVVPSLGSVEVVGSPKRRLASGLILAVLVGLAVGWMALALGRRQRRP